MSMAASVIFFDMDGVLCDFVRGSLVAHGKTLPIGECDWDFMRKVGFTGAGDMAFWEPLCNPGFWANLEPLADGLALFRAAVEDFGPDRVAILSSGLCPGSVDGKREWIRRHLPGFDVKRAVFAHAKGLCGGPGKVLVDDHDANLDDFAAAGGVSVPAPRPWNQYRAWSQPDGSFPVDTVKLYLRSVA